MNFQKSHFTMAYYFPLMQIRISDDSDEFIKNSV